LLPSTEAQARTSVKPVEGQLTTTSSAQTILLVEDDPQVRKFAQRVLNSLGYTTLAAASGTEALRTMLDRPGEVKLLITDIVMPEMTGPEVAEALRAQDPALPVLFVSGYADEVVARDGMGPGEGLFLEKPFTPAALAAKVRAALDLGKPG
jgi:CheY-like chemotaxis protein